MIFIFCKLRVIKFIYFVVMYKNNDKINWYLPVIEQRRRKVGALPEYWLIIPWLCAFGAGILSVIALWNLRRLGSTVTIGDTATPRPSNLAVKSGSIGWA